MQTTEVDWKLHYDVKWENIINAQEVFVFWSCNLYKYKGEVKHSSLSISASTRGLTSVIRQKLKDSVPFYNLKQESH